MKPSLFLPISQTKFTSPAIDRIQSCVYIYIYIQTYKEFILLPGFRLMSLMILCHRPSCVKSLQKKKNSSRTLKVNSYSSI